ncbi:hypothetical protein V6N12_012468 [Hibiscus sabdariffa]|uniref:NB-ARC domain-containing protein n=1 Tax=Hibiscus sabdariffa TaxID=183260 RepID=A0ABR1ZFW1_9ROSI
MQKERTLILIKQSFNLLLLKWLQPSFLISFLRAVLSWKQYSITFRTGFLCSASLGTSFPGCLHIYRGGSLRSSSPNKLVRRAMDFALNKIGEYVDNHRSLDQRMKDLKRKLEQLNGLKEDAESIMTIELQPRKKSKAEVQIWFKNVKRINDEVQDLDGRIGESNALTRGFHAEDASRKIKEVEELINQRRQFHGGLVVDNPRWIGQVLSTTSLSGEAVKACIEEIWQCLMDDEVRKIGVWGMGGVGKSSIMKLINNQLLKEAGRFDTVIWITVSKEMCIAKLQEDIASKIGVKFSGDKDETTRAGKLYVTLSQKNRFVMIFDDLWEKVSLEIIGIPEPSVGSKLVLTTRSADVCKQMDCKVIEVKRLTEEEAWKLFSEKVGHAILNNPEVEPYARPIAKRCGGLPLGVITIASCMRGIDDICEWRNALTELSLHKKSVNGLKDEVFQQLQFSYDRLKNPKLQQCFLTCALYPEDWAISEEQLIQLWIAEGLVEEMDSVKAELDRGRAIVNRLIKNCLLEVFIERENGRTVKMHDLLRDMALHIAESRFLVKAGMMLKEAPNAKKWGENLEKVSLMRNLQLYIPSTMSPPMCPRLTTLLLSNCNMTSIPEDFFENMHGLKVLDLCENSIKSLPHSLSKCPRLTTLLLLYCGITSIPEDFFKHRNGLRVLDLSRNPIKSLPHFLSKCHGLTTLLLSNCNITSIPEDFFKYRNGIRVLDLSGNPIKSLPHSLSKCLNLTTLLLSGCRIMSIPEELFIPMDALEVLDLSENPIKSLPRSLSNLTNLTSLLLQFCQDLEHAPLPSLSNLRVLKKLDLHQTEIKEIPQGMENLVSLEYLNMDCIYQIPNGILSRLSCLQVLNVGEKLISGEEVGGLKKLKVLEGRFDDWDNLNMYLQGFHDREEPSEYRISVGEFIMLPRDIEKLKINNCDLDGSGEYPLFSRFILFSHAPFSSLNFLEIYGCEYMKKLFSPNCVPLNLQKLRVSECYELEEIIASEVEQEERGMEFRLPQLRELELRDLPQLKRICSVHVLLVCDSLVKIRIQNCVELERMSLNLPRLDNVPPPAPDSISIQIWPQEWWESVEWDAKPHLAPIFVRDRW